MNRRRRELLAALQPAVDTALARKPEGAHGIKVNALSATTTEVMLYGVIGGGGIFDEGGVTAAGMAEVLRDITTPHISLRINSGGGDVFDGVAIHSLLARHPAFVTADVDGIAASAASFIALAADRVRIARNAMMMIHDGMTGAYGNADTMRRTADLLEKVSANIADIYAQRAGGTAEEWRALMTVNAEDGTWYTGLEAVDAGLADTTVGDDEDEEVTARARHAVDAALGAHWLTAVPDTISARLQPSPVPGEPSPPEPQPLPEVIPEAGAAAVVESTTDDPGDTFAHRQARAFLAAALRIGVTK